MTEDGVLLFIDAIEDDEAWVLLGEERHRLPRVLLPPGAREGVWLRLLVDPSRKVGEEIEARRERLVRGDRGGDVKL
jgi:hypothetical protein